MTRHTGVGVELLGDRGAVLLELIKKGRGDGEVVNTSEGLDFTRLWNSLSTGAMAIKDEGTYVTEGGTHHDRLVVVLLIVVEDLLDRLDTRVLIADVVLARLVLLVPVKDLRHKSQRCSRLRTLGGYVHGRRMAR